MPMREFLDEHGRHWIVWDVYPTLIERRLRNAGPPRGLGERRRKVELRSRVSTRLSAGWLAFEAEGGERRRLSPIPDEDPRWADASEQQLRKWCAIAEQAPPARRLVE